MTDTIPAPAPLPGQPPPKKGLSLLAWIAIGLGGFLALGFAGCLALGVFVFRPGQEAVQ